MAFDLPSRPRILVIRLSSLGDVLACLPAAGALRRRFPDARISWAVDDRFEGLVRHAAAVDAILPFPRRGGAAAAAGFLHRLSERTFDLAIDLHGNLRSGLTAWFSRAPVRLGHPPGRSREANRLFITARPDADPSVRHRSHRTAAILSLLGGTVDLAPQRLVPDPALRRAALERIARDLPGAGKLAILHPGSSPKGAYKRWPADRFAELAGRLHARGTRILWFGGPDDAELARRLQARLDGPSAFAAPEGIDGTIALLSAADLYVGSDSGPAYLAQAAGVPTAILFGPKDPADYGPLSDLKASVYHPLPCSPCRNIACPHVRCMDLISVDEMERKAMALLK